MARLAIFTERYTIRSSVELTALTNFRLAAFELGHELDFVFRNELKYLAQYDAVFIRALTDPLNTAYVVARSVEMMGKRVIDTSESIRVCCDKINMYGRLARAGVPIPETLTLGEREITAARGEELLRELGAPLVLKAPNSSFSAYVEKVTTAAEFVQVGRRYLRRADRIVVQRYLPSSFDWRVITLHGKVLAVVEYRFAAERWKVMQRGGEGEAAVVRAIPREEAPKGLLAVALRASAAIDEGLHGVDLKEFADPLTGETRYAVIEVNDNPTIAATEEDAANPEIYTEIVRYLAEGPAALAHLPG